MNRQPPITIVGGGLVGALLAVMLGRRGYRVTVFEKRPDMRREVLPAGRSINLALAQRGIAALRQAELFDDVEPLLIPMRGRMLHPLNGPLEFSPYGQRPEEVIYSVSRGRLNETMLSEAEGSRNVNFFFDHECVGVDVASRQITLRNVKTHAERTEPYEILIGTDGANSLVRDTVVTQGGGAWKIDWLDHDYKELHIPPAADGGFQIDPQSLHIWPRHGFMVIALPNLDGSFTVTLFLQKEGETSFANLKDAAAVERFFADQFPDTLPLIPDLAKTFFENPTGVLGTVRCSKWTDGDRLGLLGDAAHAIVPFHGQGMNSGFEDCAVLLQILAAHHDDWAATWMAFEQARVENADAIADMALENYVIMRDSVLDPRFQMKKEIGFQLERKFPDRFIPRYSMVMFHEIPYATVKRRGQIQDSILERLIGTETDVTKVDLAPATAMITAELEPLPLPA